MKAYPVIVVCLCCYIQIFGDSLALSLQKINTLNGIQLCPANNISDANLVNFTVTRTNAAYVQVSVTNYKNLWCYVTVKSSTFPTWSNNQIFNQFSGLVGPKIMVTMGTAESPDRITLAKDPQSVMVSYDFDWVRHPELFWPDCFDLALYGITGCHLQDPVNAIASVLDQPTISQIQSAHNGDLLGAIQATVAAIAKVCIDSKKTTLVLEGKIFYVVNITLSVPSAVVDLVGDKQGCTFFEAHVNTVAQPTVYQTQPVAGSANETCVRNHVSGIAAVPGASADDLNMAKAFVLGWLVHRTDNSYSAKGMSLGDCEFGQCGDLCCMCLGEFVAEILSPQTPSNTYMISHTLMAAERKLLLGDPNWSGYIKALEYLRENCNCK